MNARRFAGKVALVTGATTGIGLATAEAFALEGAQVILSGRREAEGQAAAGAIRANGGSAIFVAADMGRLEEIEGLISGAISEFGQLDIAFNNAGLEGIPFVATADYDDDNFRTVVDVNLLGVFRCMKGQIAQMLRQGSGTIVNTVSGAGLRANTFGAAYTASKWGLVGMTQSAALEYAARNIRINAVCPGVVRTAMADRAYVKDGVFDASIVAAHPIGRIGEPIEVAHAVLWLCSSEASFITGAVLPVDGGATL